MDTAWLTDEAVAALAAVRDANGKSISVDARKRRHTIYRLTWAMAMEGIRSDDDFFEREKGIPKGDPRRDDLLTARSTWWKVRDLPDIVAARIACQAAADTWRDRETQQAQTEARRQIILGLAKHSDRGVVEGLLRLIEDSSAKGSERLQAIDRFVQLLSPELAERIPGEKSSQAMAVEVHGLDAFIEHELARVAGGGEAGVVDAATLTGDGLSDVPDTAG